SPCSTTDSFISSSHAKTCSGNGLLPPFMPPPSPISLDTIAAITITTNTINPAAIKITGQETFVKSERAIIPLIFLKLSFIFKTSYFAQERYNLYQTIIFFQSLLTQYLFLLFCFRQIEIHYLL